MVSLYQRRREWLTLVLSLIKSTQPPIASWDGLGFIWLKMYRVSISIGWYWPPSSDNAFYGDDVCRLRLYKWINGWDWAWFSANAPLHLSCLSFAADIYDEVSSSLAGLGLETECVGGGRIEHRPDLKRIKIYGYSQAYGKADHDQSKRLLQTDYPDYEIEASDEGYWR